MKKRYNLDNFEASFKDFLIAGNKNKQTVKSYLSDIRYFFNWFLAQIRHNDNIKDILSLITAEKVLSFKSYLVNNKTPHKTINRRLSSLRKFCSFCISQGWVDHNPAKQIANVQFPVREEKNNLLLSRFKDYLTAKKLTEKIIEADCDNIKDFLSVLI